MTISQVNAPLKVFMLSLIMYLSAYGGTESLAYEAPVPKDYQHMTTEALQKEVEVRSIKGTLPFSMGLELIKRWSHQH